MDLNQKLTLLFSAIVAISTIVYAYLTRKLVRETKATRLLQITPDVQVYLAKAETETHIVYLIIENFGYGVAVEVKFNIIKDYNHYDSEKLKISRLGAFKHGLRYFYPKQKYKYFFTSLLEKYEDKIKDSIEIGITFKDIYNKEYQRTFILTIDEILGSGQMINPPDSYVGKIWYELSEIKKVLKKDK